MNALVTSVDGFIDGASKRITVNVLTNQERKTVNNIKLSQLAKLVEIT